MKFILDAAVLQADTLNRTAVLPSFVYARACERPMSVPCPLYPWSADSELSGFYSAVCAEHLPMVNRGDALQKDEWRKRPHDEQMGWKMPLEVCASQLLMTGSNVRSAHDQPSQAAKAT